MSTKHSPALRLHAAGIKFRLASDNCPHEGEDFDCWRECCNQYDLARRELRSARKSAERYGASWGGVK